MELPSRYNVYLDYQGYQIEARSYRVSPAPLMGTKFTTGRSAYSDLDFWQIGAMTDFSKGVNQKYMVDPSMTFESIGLYPAKPGEVTLERDTESFKAEGLEKGDVITAHYRRLNELYLGDKKGNIIKSTDGINFEIVYTIPDKEPTVYGFYEIAGRFFATTGPGNIYSNEDPDSSDAWSKEAVSTQFPLPDYDQDPGNNTNIYGTENKAIETFKVGMGGNTFQTLKVKVKKVGTPDTDLEFKTYEEDLETAGQPGVRVSAASWSIDKSEVTTSWQWVEINAAAEFDLRAGIIYYLQAEADGSGVDASNYYEWGYEEGWASTYESGNGKVWDETESEWTDKPYRSYYFELRRETILDLYYVMVESDYAFGWFGDGIRRSIDGYNWIPEPPDPLWVMPSGEGIPLNAVAIPKSFISGSQRGLWAFVGGSSGINLWDFPDYTNPNNFRGLEKWGHLAIFSVEDQGLYYTDGSQVIPTTLTYLGEGFTFKSCKHIHSNGWDVYALVSDNGTDWYLARTNMNYNGQPKYWWIVKKLDKEPARIVGWDDEKVFIFYEDTTTETFDKINGPYVEEGHMTTSWVDENMIKILKMYNNVSAMYSTFPGDGTVTNSTYSKLSYLKDRQTNYIDSEIYYGNPGEVETDFTLPNPTVGNRIKVKLTLGRPETDNSIAPIVTDLTWKYILQKPREDVLAKRNYVFTVIAEDSVEDYLLDHNAPGTDEPVVRPEILGWLWETSAKKEVLNYIGADNKSEVGIEIDSNDLTHPLFITIDRTNYTIDIITHSDNEEFTASANIGGGINSYSYKDKTLTTVVSELNALHTNMTFSVHRDQTGTRTANDLEPCFERTVAEDNNTYLMVGTDVHAVIMGTNSPSQSKLEMDGRGSDRLQIALREA